MYAHSYILAKIIMALSAHFPENVVDQWFENAEILVETLEHNCNDAGYADGMDCVIEYDD